ncbi:hypothetical protein MPSEU_000426000 [Mayamaea pseudoterrestris]|nr:hypothetical protein MPSEU_000426000 [Mayamaea pseudoterrestris]
MALIRPFVAPLLPGLFGVATFLLSGLLLIQYHVHAAASVVSDSSDQHEVPSKERVHEGADAFNALDKLLFGVLMLIAFELLDYITRHSGLWLGSKQIPVRGKHLDDLMLVDRFCIGISKAATGPFVYFYFRFAYLEPNVLWRLSELTFQNTAVALIALFIIYDFFYTILHWALHIKSVYGLIHKHHHRQKAPTRGNVDAVNVHPLEYFLGEYNHLFALFLCCRLLIQVHIVTALMFLAIGGIVAGINHTRFDIVLSVRGVNIYDSKAHDVHHRIPQSNYGQYTMLWDKVFGTYRPYDPKDRINPDAQLDPTTGKSLGFSKKAQ